MTIRDAIESLVRNVYPGRRVEPSGWQYAAWAGVTWGSPWGTHCTVDEDDTVHVWVDLEDVGGAVVPGAYEAALLARPDAVQALLHTLGLEDSPVDLLEARDIPVAHCSWSGRVTLASGGEYYLPLAAVVPTWRRFSARDRAPWAPLPSDGDPYGEAAALFRVERHQVEAYWEDARWWGRLSHGEKVWLERDGVCVEGPLLPDIWPMGTQQEAGEVRSFWHQGHLILESSMARVRLTPADRTGRFVVTGIVGHGTLPWREYSNVAHTVVEAAYRQGLFDDL